MKHHILLIDDERAVCEAMAAFLVDEGFYVKAVSNGPEAIALVRQKTIPFSLALIDYHMPDMDGIEVIKQIRAYNRELTILAFSGDDSALAHNQLLESGALQFVAKDTVDAKLLGIIHRVCREVEDKVKPLVLFDNSANAKVIESVGMVGTSQGLAEVARQILQFGPTDSTVLIRGENGTGKEMVAKALHQKSMRSSQKFVAINCGAIPEDLIESELFGHEKGAFTGAISQKVGKFQAANGGTIFLDEIGEMPLLLQVKLLRVLQEREITPVGSNVPRKINVRVIAATNAPLEDLIAQRRFRMDLYYRLNVLRIAIPPLRDRPEDITPLAAAFLKEENARTGHSKMLLESAVEKLKKHRWPGNVRELQNAISYLANSTNSHILDVSLLNFETEEQPVPLKKPKDYDALKLRSFLDEKHLIQEALKATANPTAAARKLGMKRSTFRDKLKKYGIIFEKIKMNSDHQGV